MAPPAISIRPLKLTDISALHEAVRESMKELSPWMPWCHPEYSLEDSRQWVEAQPGLFASGKEYNFVIESGASELLGICGLNAIDTFNRHANLGYWVRTSATGRGVATAAIRLLVDWAFQNTELIRLEVAASTRNLASLRVAAKAGAWREGVLRSRMLLHGKPHDDVVFSFVRPGFEA